MDLTPKKTSLLILAVTSVVFSRMMFVFFNDPEGPNLLVVGVAAAVVYGLSVGMYFIYPAPKRDGLSGRLELIVIQILIVTFLTFCLR